MSILYRYRCSLENTHVWERRDKDASVPTVCKNDAAAIVEGTLAAEEAPLLSGDVEFNVGNDLDVTDASVTGMSHTALEDIGVKTHAQIDSHVDDSTLHRVINDLGVSGTDLWSASKIGAEIASATSDSGPAPLWVFRETQKNATQAGTNEIYEWTARPLNDLHYNSGNDATVSGADITLQPGTYEVSGYACFYKTYRTKLRLYNTTDSTVAISGTLEYLRTNAQSVAQLHGVVVVASGAAKKFQLQYHAERKQKNTGLGIASGTGDVEVYSVLKLRKLA